MSIASFDVEPVDHRGLLRWVCGVVAVVTGLLAVIGWPLPVWPGRYVQNDAWDGTVRLVQAWLTHDGWRQSGASWFWGGVAIVATSGALALGRRVRGAHGVRRWVVVLAPGGTIAALGPLLQGTLGIPWSNYTPTHDAGSTVVFYAIGLVVAVGLPFLRSWVMRGRSEADDTAARGPHPFDRR